MCYNVEVTQVLVLLHVNYDKSFSIFLHNNYIPINTINYHSTTQIYHHAISSCLLFKAEFKITVGHWPISNKNWLYPNKWSSV